MPCEHQIFADGNLLVKRYSGSITLKCVLDLLDAVEADTSYVEGMVEFDDLRDTSEFAFGDDDIAMIADLIKGIDRRQRQPRKQAVLATSKGPRRAARLYCKEVADVAGLEIRVFSEVDAALSFLALSGTPLAAHLKSDRILAH